MNVGIRIIDNYEGRRRHEMIVQKKEAQDSIPEPRVPRGGVGQDQFLKKISKIYF